MPAFRIRAQWWGSDGKHCGVADDTFEGAEAIEALDNAVPGSWRTGDFTHCIVKIEPLPDTAPSSTQEGVDA
jgi:hypothetical protein